MTTHPETHPHKAARRLTAAGRPSQPATDRLLIRAAAGSHRDARDRRNGRGNDARDRGAATIYAAGLGLFLMLAGLAVALKSKDLITHAQAKNAADFAALAGASLAYQGESPACTRAAEIAIGNGATLTTCTLHALDVTVTVQVGQSTATSRAGPITHGL